MMSIVGTRYIDFAKWYKGHTPSVPAIAGREGSRDG